MSVAKKILHIVAMAIIIGNITLLTLFALKLARINFGQEEPPKICYQMEVIYKVLGII